MKKRLLTYLLMLLPLCAVAQEIVIKGTVVSEADGEPLIGATVQVAGTSVATITDLDGNYTLRLSKPSRVQFSYIGCKNRVIEVKQSGTFDVKLADDANQLDEVVAIGYGTMKKSDLTGSVAVISADNLKKTPAANIDQALQGRAAGVTVNANSGQPGAGAVVRIRGIGTVNDSNPIYVVDGIICSDISFLSPNDIESTEVLKDASATAIYGSRGANGVILVTTKKGDKGHAQVSFDAYYGWQNRWKKLDVLGREDFVNTYLALNSTKTQQNYYNNNGFNEWLQRYKLSGDGYMAVAQTEKFPDGIDYAANDTDWQDEVFRKAVIENYHVAVDGGTDKSNYSFSGNWFNQDGTIIGSNYNRLTLRANTSFQVNKWLKVGENISFVYSKGRNAMNNSGSAGASVITAALAMAPWDTPYFPQGAYNLNGTDLGGRYSAPSNSVQVTNPFLMVYGSHPKDVTNRWIGDIYLEFTPFKGFSYRTDVSYDQVDVKHRLFKEASNVNAYSKMDKNFLERSLAHYTTFMWENIVNYNFELKKIHSFNVMLGQTTEEYNYYSIGNSGSKILNPDEKNWYLSKTTEDNTNKAGDSVSRSRRLSFLGRVHYSLLDRYMMTLNFRADGSNKFPENTWGYFPSVALAWRISEEPFMKNVKHLDFLKLRAGWGQIGNDKVGNDAFNQTIFDTGPTFVGYPFGISGEIANGATILTYVNQGGKWERTETLNAGVDAAFGNGLLSVTADFFVRNTKDMLLWVKGPAWIGNRYDAQSNVGTVRNTGLELTLGHRHHIGQLNYSVDANLSFIKNKLTGLNGGAPVYGDRVVSNQGLALFTYWGYEYRGVYQSDEEIADNLPGYARDGEICPYKVGDARYVDIDGDGKIGDGDKTELGNNFPKITYGLNLGADWKGIDLQLFFQGVGGNKIYNAQRASFESLGLNHALSPVMLRTWDYDEDGIRQTDFAAAGVPNPKNSVNSENSSRFIESGSYLRLKNIQLGYTFPKTLISRIGLTKLRLYASMSNVFTITPYSGYDPEVGSGVDYGNYPQSRTFLMGVNLAF